MFALPWTRPALYFEPCGITSRYVSGGSQNVRTSRGFDSASPWPRRGDPSPQGGVGAPVFQHPGVESRRRAVGGRSHDLSCPRAGAGGVGSSRCGGRPCAARSHAALAAAEIRASRAGRDSKSRQSVADQTKLIEAPILLCSNGVLLLCNKAVKNLRSDFCQLVGNGFSGLSDSAREKGTDLSLSARHPPGRPAVDPGRPFAFQARIKRFRAGFRAPTNLAFSAATGRCRNRSESRNSVASASAKPSME